MALRMYGNLTLSQIFTIKITSVGLEAFLDTDFIPAFDNDPDWTALIKQINSEEITSPNTVAVLNRRLDSILSHIQDMIGYDCEIPALDTAIPDSFFARLQDTLTSSNVGSLPQKYLVHYCFYRFIAQLCSTLFITAPDGTREADTAAVLKFRAFISRFFIKSESGYILSYKKKTDMPVNWRTLKHVLTGRSTVLRGIDEKNIADVKQEYWIYYRLKSFERALRPWISSNRLQRAAAQVFALLDTINDRTISEKPCKTVQNGIEYLVFGGLQEQEYFDIRFFDYEYGCFNKKDAHHEPMKSLLKQLTEDGILLYMQQRSEQFNIRAQNDTTAFFDAEQEYRFLQIFADHAKLNTAFSFYHEWYRARIDYARYLQSKKMEYIAQAAASYEAAFAPACRFAGTKLELFINESLKILLEYYPLHKNTEAISKIYGWAAAAGIPVQLFREFKAAGFTSPDFNPFEVFIKLWDSGATLVHIAALTRLQISEVQTILLQNEAVLRRKDEEMLTRIIQPYEEEELCAGNIFDRFDDF